MFKNLTLNHVFTQSLLHLYIFINAQCHLVLIYITKYLVNMKRKINSAESIQTDIHSLSFFSLLVRKIDSLLYYSLKDMTELAYKVSVSFKADFSTLDSFRNGDGNQ